MKEILHKITFFLLFTAFSILCACSPVTSKEPISVTDYKLNTIITITIYDQRDTSLLDNALSLCDQYEHLFSRTDPGSELFQLNHHKLSTDENGFCTISEDTFQLIKKGLEYGKLSEGAFNIAIAPLTDLWDFTSGTAVIPSDTAINAILPHLNSAAIELKEPNQIAFLDKETRIDLGGIAKGYIADQIKAYLVSQGVKSATIDLGGNVLCIGNKGNTPFTIGIQKPFADRSETIATMKITDKSVVSSGIYERFFEKDGKIYHHILNSRTGYPYDNGLIGVTIVADCSTDADALSTACFSLGLEEGMKLINSLPDADAFFITEDYVLHYSDGFTDKYQVLETN